MMTRRALTQNTELKLQQVLEELEASKNSCDQLMLERDESEEEIKKIIEKNTKLKNELAELQSKHLEVLYERNQLENIIKNFDQCSNTYERALDRITELEQDLNAANKQISDLVNERHDLEPDSNNLFNELRSSSENFSSEQTILPKSYRSVSCNILGCNKLKRYIKINRYIKKTEKLVKKKNCFHKNVALRKERMSLMDSLEIYDGKLKDSRAIYDRDTKALLLEIESLHESLNTINEKYLSAQRKIEEQIRTTAEVTESSNSNTACYDSIIRNKNPFIKNDNNCNTSLCSLSSSVKSALLNVSPCQTSVYNKLNSNAGVRKPKTVILSDKLGQRLGPILKNKLNHEVLNICTPYLPFDKIIKNLNQYEYELNKFTNVIFLCGDSLFVKKQHIIKCFNHLVQLNSKTECKFTICAFPYAQNLSYDQNQHIYDLNRLIYHLTCRHSDNIAFFDTNKFISCFNLTTDTLYLAKKDRHKIASLLAYNLQVQDTIRGNATKSTNCNIDCTVSNSTNSNIFKLDYTSHKTPDLN